MRIFSLCASRLISAALTLLGVSILIFASAHLLPGGYADIVLGPLSTPGQRQRATAQYGLSQPILVQYWHWLSSALTGNFGHSLISHQPVSHELAQRISVTFELSALSASLAVLIGVPLGVFTALRSRASGRSSLGRLASSAGMSLPDFVLGSIVVYLFSRYSLGLTIGEYTPFTKDIGANLRSILLPAIVLSIFATSATARTARDAVLGVLVEPHVTAAVARGESPRFIVRHHILRNAATPIVIVATTVAAQLLGGVVIVESLFNLPGLGTYVVQAISRRDYAVVEACVLLAAAVFIVTNMTVDLAAGVIDPRASASARRRR